jgi:hypothetical protein
VKKTKRRIQILVAGMTNMQGCQIFLGTTYQNGKKYTKMTTKYTKWQENIPNASKMDHMALKFTNIFRRNTLQNLPKFEFLV